MEINAKTKNIIECNFLYLYFKINDRIMRFIVSSTDLLQGLVSVQKVIASKSSLPILDNFLFTLDGNTLTVTGSDGRQHLRPSLPSTRLLKGERLQFLPNCLQTH